MLKPTFLLFGGYFLLQRKSQVVLGGATVIASATLFSVGVFGLDYTLDWYQQCIDTLAAKPPGAANNQSIDGFLLRPLTGIALLRDWDPHPMPPDARVIKLAFITTLLLMTMAALWRNPRQVKGPEKGAGFGTIDCLEFCLILNICIILSPISWTHYYTMLLIVFALFVAGRLPHSIIASVDR